MSNAAYPHRRSARRLIVACALLLPSCVGAPDDAAHLSAEKPLDQRSTQGIVDAEIALETADLARGPNDFLITLHAATGDAQPVLTGVDAVMAAHGHHAGAPSIVADSDGVFHVEQLDLFMSGRWQVTLGVELETRSDTVDFALDVP